MVVVNIGCGASPTPGAVNLDRSFSVTLGRRPLLFKLLNGLHILSPDQAAYADFCRTAGITRASCLSTGLADGSADVVYSSHMLEHLPRESAAAFLREARRILKPDGVLRISVPDMALLIDKYNEDGDCDALLSASLLAPAPVKTLRQKLLYLASGHRGHYWMYDEASLTRLLQANGFPSCTRLKAGETTIPGDTGINLSERADESLYIEAR